LFLISFSYAIAPAFVFTNPNGTIFQENFESYSVGSFPSSWVLWFSGAGEEYQYVTDEVSVSGSKSFKMRGADHWASCAARYFSTSASIIGYEVYVRVNELTGYRYTAMVGFGKKTSGATSNWYAGVVFKSDGTVSLGGNVFHYETNRWYKVKVIFDRDRGVYSAWVDDQLLASDVPSANGYEIEAFCLASEWAGVDVWFDDVKVFYIEEEELTGDIWTNKGGQGYNQDGGSFQVGEAIKIYFEVSSSAYVKVYDEFPNGTWKLLDEGQAQAGTTYQISGIMGEPSGYRIFHLVGPGDEILDSCYVEVTAAGQPPSLTLYEPEIDGLTVTVNGVTTPGTPGASITRLHWDWGDGHEEDHWFPASHTYAEAGIYTITVTSYQSDGLSTTKSITVTVSAQPTCSVQTDKLEYELGEIVIITVSPTPAYGVGYWLVIYAPDGSKFKEINCTIGQNTYASEAGPYLGKYKVELWALIAYPNATPFVCAYTYYEVVASAFVKFRGTIQEEPPNQYDVVVKIDEVLSDPEGKLNIGDLAHIDIADDLSQSDVDWPLHKGDRVEIYAKHYEYDCYNGEYAICTWIYTKYHEYDGYVKLIEEMQIKIVNIDYPSKVYVGQSFGIAVTVDYSFTTLTSIMIQVYEHAGPLLSETRDTLSGAGQKTYSFTLTAPSQPKTWQLNIHAFYWKDGEWVQGDIKSIKIRVVEHEFDFSLSASPSSQKVEQGGSASYDVQARLESGTPKTVHLSVTGLPPGTTYFFNPESGEPSFSSKLTITTSKETPKGIYILTIKGESEGKERTITVTLIVEEEKKPKPEAEIKRIGVLFDRTKFYEEWTSFRVKVIVSLAKNHPSNRMTVELLFDTSNITVKGSPSTKSIDGVTVSEFVFTVEIGDIIQRKLPSEIKVQYRVKVNTSAGDTAEKTQTISVYNYECLRRLQIDWGSIQFLYNIQLESCVLCLKFNNKLRNEVKTFVETRWRDIRDKYELAREICNWVQGAIKYDNSSSSRQPTYFYMLWKQIKEEGYGNVLGDCTDYAILFVGMCRAVGIKARFVSSVFFSYGIEEERGHDFAEVYIKGNWIHADPQNGKFDAPYEFEDPGMGEYKEAKTMISALAPGFTDRTDYYHSFAPDP